MANDVSVMTKYLTPYETPLMYVVAGDRSTVTGEQWPVSASFK